MKTKQVIEDELQKKEDQLYKAQRESEAWSKGKYKNSSNAINSKLLVESLQKEVNELRHRLETLQ